MVRRKHTSGLNQVLILGLALLIPGLLLAFTGSSRPSLQVFNDEVQQTPLIIQNEEGQHFIVRSPSSQKEINHNAADDPAFKGVTEDGDGSFLVNVLGLYDADLRTALETILLAAGSILIILSVITPRLR